MTLLLEWAALCLIWMLLIGEWRPSDLWVGMVAAALATLASRTVRQCKPFQFAFEARQVAQAWRIPGYALTGTWELLTALGVQVFARSGMQGRLRAVPFDPGRDDSRADRTRCALAIAFTSSTPNFVVLGIDRRHRVLLYHQVKPGRVLEMTRALGAAGGEK
jgi:multisubunit Na+/H+ antiporter MnhE subunit